MPTIDICVHDLLSLVLDRNLVLTHAGMSERMADMILKGRPNS